MEDSPRNAAELAEHLLRTNRWLRRLSEKLRRRQERLRRVLTAGGLNMYAQLEAATKECLSELVDLIWDAARKQRRLDPRPQSSVERPLVTPSSRQPNPLCSPTATSWSAAAKGDHHERGRFDLRSRQGGR
ncbi:MAG: hypothetical protein QM784_27730 [Polyangiaceae bacterium]